MKLWGIIPELVVAATCLSLVPLAGLVRERWRRAPFVLAALGLLAGLVATARMGSWEPVSVFEGAYAADGFGHAFKALILVAALLCLVALQGYLRSTEAEPHAPVALCFTTLGAMALVSSDDLLLVVLFLQMMSMALYVIVAIVRRSERSLEAAIKLFLYAAAGLAVSAYGFTLLYGLTGSLELSAVAAGLKSAPTAFVGVALALVVIGYALEVTVVPFHVWSPDAYEGAPAPVSALLSTVPKIAALAALVRLLLVAIPVEVLDWRPLVAGGAALTMTLGNFAALKQTSVKRLLAYSSIGHAGFLLMAVAVAPTVQGATVAIAFHLAAYLFMNIGAFAAVAYVERSVGNDVLSSFAGLGRASPVLAVGFALCLLSLAGIPPLGGFIGKVLLLDVAIEGELTWLAVLAAANMLVALWYYVRLVAEMFLSSREDTTPLDGRLELPWLVSACAGASVVLGVVPGPFLSALSIASL